MRASPRSTWPPGLKPATLDREITILRDAAPGPRLFLDAPITGYSETGADPRTDVSAVDHIRTLVFNGAVIDREAPLTVSQPK
jgi:hypothetical protein